MTDTFITSADPGTGDVTRYRHHSNLLPFLETYHPKDGYRIEIKHMDLLSLQRGRLVLLREAVIAGKKPSEVGLPDIEADMNTLICTASLLDSQNRMVRSASASMRISDPNDVEAMEAAANLRLLASLGFGSEDFDDDEDHDPGSLQASHRSSEVSSATSPTESPGADASPHGIGASFTTATLSALDDDEPVTDAEHQHIATLAQRANTTAPTLRTRADVKAAQQRLSHLAQQHRVNGHDRADETGA
jgi:hypothetical protein